MILRLNITEFICTAKDVTTYGENNEYEESKTTKQ